jgi:5-methylcytosine-specific restriction endonuclease McrA
MGKRKGAFSDKTREAVYERAAGRCERCGGTGSVWHFHHRRPRGMGGTSRADSGNTANALLLHPSCHEWVERNRAAAYDMGYLVDQQSDPCGTRVKLWDGWVILTDTGTYQRDQ